MTEKIKNLDFFKNFTLQFVCAVILFAVSAYLASHAGLSNLETSIFNTIYRWPEALEPMFLFVTQFGSIYILLILSVLYLLKKYYHIVIRLLMSGMLAYLLAGVAKDLVGRPRPSELLLDIIVRDFYVRGPGFPSGHVALATAIALTLGRYIPRKYLWLVPLFVISVAVSRVYLGAHAPLDLVGGFAIGWVATLLFRNVKLLDINKHPQARGKSALKKK